MASEQGNGFQNRAEQTLKSGAEQARAGINQAEKKGQDTLDRLSEMKDTANEKWQDVKEAAKSAAQNVQHQSEEVIDSVSEYVKKNPIKSLGIAALTGAIVAALLRS